MVGRRRKALALLLDEMQAKQRPSNTVGGERLDSWFGEILAASNNRPGAEYEDITDVHSEFGVPTDLSDEEIMAYVSKDAPDYDIDPKGWSLYVSRRLDDLIGKSIFRTSQRNIGRGIG